MKSIRIGLLLLFLSFQVNGYGYIKDVMYYDNDTLIVNQIPLEPEFKQFIKSESVNLMECSTMKCDIGYRIWELRNDSLFLIKIVNCCGKESLNKKSQNLLMASYQKNEVFAHWLNHAVDNQYGTLIANVAERLIYEFDREFIVEDGILKEIISYDNRASRKSVYFENKDSLSKTLCRLINWDLIEQNNCDLDKTIVANFWVNQDRKAEDIKIYRGQNEACEAEIKRVIERFPEFDLYLKKGKPIDMRWNLPIKLKRLNYCQESA